MNMNFREKLKSLFQEIEVKPEVKPEVQPEVKAVVKPEKFMDVAVGDKMFRTDTEELVEGAYIFEVMLVEGEEVIGKVEDGEYETADGVKFVVENDTIVSITMPEGETESVETDFQEIVLEGFEAFRKRIEVLTKTNTDLTNELNKMKSDFSAQIKEIKELPAESGVKLIKSGFQSTKKEKTDFSYFQDLAKKYRK